jgi:hypothetical protein
MKNIHILPTDKPSRVFTWGNKLRLGDFVSCPDYFGKLNKNIYITSDEEIKEVDYVIQINFEKTNIQVIKCENESQVKIANSKNGSFTKNKIILTTDQDLIKDGVQAIDDEFLEWFVKNPSCEFVETYSLGIQNGETGESYHYKYEIIIPKEEPKQETLEEVAERILFENTKNVEIRYRGGRDSVIKSMLDIAKWQQQQDKNKYSEE